MARYSLIPSCNASFPNAARADFRVMHKSNGILSNSSPSFTDRRARRPRPELSLVISSTVSVLMAMGWGASPQVDVSARYTPPSVSSQLMRAELALSFGLPRPRFGPRRPFIFISSSNLPGSFPPPASMRALTHSASPPSPPAIASGCCVRVCCVKWHCCMDLLGANARADGAVIICSISGSMTALGLKTNSIVYFNFVFFSRTMKLLLDPGR
mmetsp:Transcript_17374/g.36643  ORF Transcript_17374/g.36643 Transcript_17374/m.36643 type:complete len:213 (+) Transcript_17374:1200-1838(+)